MKKTSSILSQIKAAHNLSFAFENRQAPNPNALKTLGLDPKLARLFKR